MGGRHFRGNVPAAFLSPVPRGLAVLTQAGEVPVPQLPSPRRIAIFNDSAPILSTMRQWCEMHGHGVFSAQVSQMAMPHLNIERVVLTNRSEVVVYDVAMPYESSWDFLDVIRQQPALAGIPFVLTTNNKAALESVVGTTEALQMMGKPAELTALLGAIDTASMFPGLALPQEGRR
jgi:CheY-like chemotaxis protein